MKTKNIVLLTLVFFMVLGAPFSWAASSIDRLALESYPSFKAERVYGGTVAEVTREYSTVLDSVPYPGFEALNLRYLYLTGQNEPVWKACQNGAMSSFFTSVRFYCYDLAWAYDVKQPYKWARLNVSTITTCSFTSKIRGSTLRASCSQLGVTAK